MKRLKGIQNHIQIKRNHRGLRRLKQKLQHDMNDFLKKEELMWVQRSMEKWLVDSDRNTKYYHLKIVQHRRRNNIVKIRDDNDKWNEEESKVRRLFIIHYKKMFSLNDTRKKWVQPYTLSPNLNMKLW